MRIVITKKEALTMLETIDKTIDLINDLNKRNLINSNGQKHCRTQELQKLSDKITEELNNINNLVKHSPPG